MLRQPSGAADTPAISGRAKQRWRMKCRGDRRLSTPDTDPPALPGESGLLATDTSRLTARVIPPPVAVAPRLSVFRVPRLASRPWHTERAGNSSRVLR